MGKPGTKHMMMGAAIAALGGGLKYGAPMLPVRIPYAHYLTLGVLGLGGLIFLYGLLQFVNYLTYSPEKKAAYHAKIGYHAMVNAMMAMAAADLAVMDSEIRKMRAICLRVTGNEPSDYQVRMAIAHFQNSNTDLAGYLGGMAGMITADYKADIIRASYLMARADSRLAELEMDKLYLIGRGLGTEHEEVDIIIAEGGWDVDGDDPHV